MPPRLMDGAFSMDRHTSNGKVSSNLLENLDASHKFLQLASLLGQRILRSEVPRTSIVNKNHFFPVTPVFKRSMRVAMGIHYLPGTVASALQT